MHSRQTIAKSWMNSKSFRAFLSKSSMQKTLGISKIFALYPRVATFLRVTHPNKICPVARYRLVNYFRVPPRLLYQELLKQPHSKESTEGDLGTMNERNLLQTPSTARPRASSVNLPRQRRDYVHEADISEEPSRPTSWSLRSLKNKIHVPPIALGTSKRDQTDQHDCFVQNPLISRHTTPEDFEAPRTFDLDQSSSALRSRLLKAPFESVPITYHSVILRLVAAYTEQRENDKTFHQKLGNFRNKIGTSGRENYSWEVDLNCVEPAFQTPAEKNETSAQDKNHYIQDSVEAPLLLVDGKAPIITDERATTLLQDQNDPSCSEPKSFIDEKTWESLQHMAKTMTREHGIDYQSALHRLAALVFRKPRTLHINQDNVVPTSTFEKKVQAGQPSHDCTSNVNEGKSKNSDPESEFTREDANLREGHRTRRHVSSSSITTVINVAPAANSSRLPKTRSNSSQLQPTGNSPAANTDSAARYGAICAASAAARAFNSAREEELASKHEPNAT